MMTRRVATGVLAAVVGLLVLIPTTARAAGIPRAREHHPVAAMLAATSDAQIIAAAQEHGQSGVLVRYDPASASWTQIAVIGSASTALQPDALSPEVSWTPRFACLLVSFTLSGCVSVAVTDEGALPQKAAAIVSRFETIDDKEAKLLREGNTEIEKQRKILEGSSSEKGDTAEGGLSDGADGAGVEDSFFDWGSDVAEVLGNVSWLAFG